MKNLISVSESDQSPPAAILRMKVTETSTWSSTLVPRSSDRWHVPVHTCPHQPSREGCLPSTALRPSSKLHDQYAPFQQVLRRICHYGPFASCALPV